MEKKLSELVKELEEENKELKQRQSQLYFEINNDRAAICVLYYAMKHDWVKEMVEESDIDFKQLCFHLEKDCSKEEIQDYISHLKSIERRGMISKIIEKLDDPKEQLFILTELINNKEV